MQVRALFVGSPAYRATLLYFYSSCSQSALTLPKNVCTSCCKTCRRFRCFYGESMGKYGQFHGQFYGQFSTSNNFPIWKNDVVDFRNRRYLAPRVSKAIFTISLMSGFI